MRMRELACGIVAVYARKIDKISKTVVHSWRTTCTTGRSSVRVEGLLTSDVLEEQWWRRDEGEGVDFEDKGRDVGGL